MQVPELPYAATLPGMLHHVAARFGERDLIVTRDRRLSYAEAERASRRIARELLAAGVGKGTRIGLQFHNSIEWVLAWLAVTRIGAVFVPLSTAYKPVELLTAVRHADLDSLIVPATMFGADHLAFVEEALPSLETCRSPRLFLDEAPFLRAIRVCGAGTSGGPAGAMTSRAWSTPMDLSPDAPEAALPVTDSFLDRIELEVAPADFMLMIYTSGTTAEPKGVMHTHGSVIRHGFGLSEFIQVPMDRRTYCGSPFFWVAGIGLLFGSSMPRGAMIMTLDKHDDVASLELMRREQATYIMMWPTLRQKLDHTIASRGLEVLDIPVFAAQAAAKIEFGTPPGHNSLGMTETWGPHSGPGKELGRLLPPELQGSFGVPVPGVQHRIADPTSGSRLPPEEEGELCVRGYSLMSGLYKRERHETFDDDGWFHTGDKAFFRDGYLFYRGRSSEMIKSAGANVAPGEVEAAMYGAPGVGLAVAVGLPDAERGEIVGVALLARPGAALELAAIRAHATQVLSSYKQPRRYLLLAENELPYLASGKPDKRRLREWFAERGV